MLCIDIYIFSYAPINVKPAGGGGGGGRAWGGDLIVFVVPGVGHLTDLVLPGEGIFDCRLGRKRLRPNIIMFPLPRFTHARTVWKIMEAINESKRGFHCFVFKFRLL